MKAYDLICLENLSFGIFRAPELIYQRGGSVQTPPIWDSTSKSPYGIGLKKQIRKQLNWQKIICGFRKYFLNGPKYLAITDGFGMYVLIINCWVCSLMSRYAFCMIFFYIGIYQEFLRKDRQKELLYNVNLKRACKKVLYQLVYIGKKVCIP